MKRASEIEKHQASETYLSGQIDFPSGFRAETESPGEASLKTTFVREVRAIYKGVNRVSTKITGADTAADFIRKILPDNSREHFVALYLDGAHQVAGFSVVATVTANSCPVHSREIFQNAILIGAVAIIVSHNHPSGDKTPSPEDWKVTRMVNEAGKLLGIKFLDHIIVTERSFYSFCEVQGLN